MFWHTTSQGVHIFSQTRHSFDEDSVLMTTYVALLRIGTIFCSDLVLLPDAETYAKRELLTGELSHSFWRIPFVLNAAGIAAP